MPRRPITWREALKDGAAWAATCFACAGLIGGALALVFAAHVAGVALLFGVAWLVIQGANAMPATTASVLRGLEWAWLSFGLLPTWAKFALPAALVFAGITAGRAVVAHRDSRR